MEEIIYHNKQVEDFYNTLRNHKESQMDIYVNPQYLRMNDEGKIELKDESLPHMVMRPTHYFEQSLAAKLRIPYDYYMRLDNRMKAENVNYWLELESGNKLLRTMALKNTNEIIARAYLSDRYMIIDNYDIMTVVLKVLQESNKHVEFHRAFISDKMMNVNIIEPHTPYNIGTSEKPDIVYFGMNIQNSEVGYSAFTMKYFIYRGICTNGMIYGGNELRKVHLGSRYTNDNEWMSNRSRRLQGELLLSQVRDMTNYVFDDDTKQIMIEKMKEAKGQRINGTPSRIIDAYKDVLDLTQEEADAAWRILKEPTRYEIVQAITQTAQVHEIAPDDKNKTTNAERRLTMEEKAGDLMFDDKVWDAFLKATE